MIEPISEEDPAAKELLSVYGDYIIRQQSVATLFHQLDSLSNGISLKMEKIFTQFISDEFTSKTDDKLVPSTSKDFEDIISEKKKLDKLLEAQPDLPQELKLIAQLQSTGISTIPE